MDLQPSGLQFDRPVTLTITFPAPVDPEGLLGGLLTNDGAQLDLSSVVVDGSTVSFELMHFTAGVIARATLHDFERDIRPILDSLTIPVSPTAALYLISRVGNWIETFGIGICSGTDLCARAFSISAESLSQNQQQACDQTQAFIQQGEPFLARDRLITVVTMAVELVQLSESADQVGLPGFEIVLDTTCVAEKLTAISDVAKAEAIANPRAGVLLLLKDVSGDAALLDLDDVAQHALAALLDALHQILDEAKADCLVAPASVRS